MSREKGCRYAKCVAEDYNPLHDKDAKKFSAPGDLVLAKQFSPYRIRGRKYITFAA
ncbi:DUF3581 family protein, partial [Pseudoalteromonas sp. S979]|uniref:DUF3581 family protein n=1 Tax=Pseudoalteromonas sp. S979 TaxID=579570 RepID=UPI002016E637